MKRAASDMKNYFSYILLAVFVTAVSFSSCRKVQKEEKQEVQVVLTEEQRNELKDCISKENRRVPFMFGTMGLVKHMSLQGGHMRIFVEINPNYFKMAKIKREKQTIRNDFYSNLVILDDSYDPLFKKLSDYGVGLRVELSSESVEDYVEVCYTAKELAYLADTKQADADAKDILRAHIAAYNLSLPMRARENIILDFIEMDQDYIVFNFTVEEPEGNEMNRIRAAKPVMAMRILSSLKTSDAHTVKEVLELCRKAEYGICYRYVGHKTEQQVTMYFDHDKI